LTYVINNVGLKKDTDRNTVMSKLWLFRRKRI